METALALPENSSLALPTDDFNQLAKSGDYLPRLQLVLASSPLAQERKVSIGNYGLVKSKDSVVDLGDQVSIYPINVRALALYTKSDPPIANYDMHSDVFKDMQKKALADSNSGYLVGPQFLLWIPCEQTFATFFMASKTAKNKADELRKMIPKATTLKSILIRKGQYSWYGPVITPCSVQLEAPKPEELARVINSFLNPKASEVEVATQEGRAER